MEWKDNMQSRAEGNFFSKADHLEGKNQEGTNWERVKEQRLVFIHLLVRLLIHLPAIKALAV